MMLDYDDADLVFDKSPEGQIRDLQASHDAQHTAYTTIGLYPNNHIAPTKPNCQCCSEASAACREGCGSR